MGKPTGFLEFERKIGQNDSVKERITHFITYFLRMNRKSKVLDVWIVEFHFVNQVY